MTVAECLRLSPADLLDYWLDDVEDARQHATEEHLFECAACSDRLATIVRLGAAVRRELLRGGVTFVTSMPFVLGVKEAGWRVREYELDPGGSVNCTVTPDDDFVVAYLRAPLQDVRRLDLKIDDSTAGAHRFEDVPFDREAEGVAAVTSTAYLRTLGRNRQRVQLVAVDEAGERVLGDYTFNHYPS